VPPPARNRETPSQFRCSLTLTCCFFLFPFFFSFFFFFFFHRSAPAPKAEEIKFDKKLSKTGKLESFGVDLAEQVAREGSGMIPKVVLACTAAIEKKGMDRVGIYRLSAVQSKINKLQLEFMNGHEYAAISPPPSSFWLWKSAILIFPKPTQAGSP